MKLAVHRIFIALSRNTQILVVRHFSLSTILLLTFSFIFLPETASAKNYYFSSVIGNDANTTTQVSNPATPWRTLSKLNSSFSALLPGDTIFFRRGDVFFGSIIITRSGNATRPIVFAAYGSGAKPIISGFVNLSSWTSVGNGIFQASAPSLKAWLNLVTINNVPQALGRFPNATEPNGGYLSYESFNDTFSITDNQLLASPNWTGAEVVIRKRLWALDRCRITNHSGNTINFRHIGATDNIPTANYGYFIQNDARTLDQFGEWYFNPTTRNLQIFFGASIPAGTVVRAAAIDTLVFANTQRYLQFQNLAFEGANTDGINTFNCDHITIKQCDFTNIGSSSAFLMRTSDVLIENSTSYNALSNGFWLASNADSNGVIRNCSIKRTGVLRGMGQSGSNSYKAIRADLNRNSLIEYNVIDTAGYVGIDFDGSNVTIRNNLVNYFCFNKDDAGGIYCWDNPLTFSGDSAVYTNRIIASNIVLNGISAFDGRPTTAPFVSGIYMDGATMNIQIVDNTIFDVEKNGIHCNNPTNVVIRGNTSFNNLNAVSFKRSEWMEVRDVFIRKNILYPKLPSQRQLYYSNSALNFPVTNTLSQAISSIGDIDSNIYSNTNKVGFMFEVYPLVGGSLMNFSPHSYEAWRALSNHDFNSRHPLRETYSTTFRNTIGNNLFANGQFTSNISGVTSFGNNVVSTWDNTSKIDGAGSLRMEFLAPRANWYGLLHSPVGNLSAGKSYVLRFKTRGGNNNGIARVYIRKTASPWNDLTPRQIFNFGSGVTQHQAVFVSPETDAGSFAIEIEQNSGTTYVDAIEFFEADAIAHNIDEQIRIEYNADRVNKTISLGANYIDPEGTYYPGSITLAPFTSRILLKDTSIVRSPLTISVSSSAINCFGDSATVTVTASGGIPPYSGTGVFRRAAGTHPFTVRDLRNVPATSNTTITQPDAPLQVIATAGTITVAGGRTTVVVTATGGTSPYSGTRTITNVAAGTYTYTVTDARGCVASRTITITQPLPLTASSSATTINCFGGNSTVTVSATGGVAPYTGTGNFVVTAGSYTYTVRDALGATTTTTINVTQPSLLAATAVAGTVTTFGGSTSVVVSATGGTPPYTGTGTINNVLAGTYSYTVTDARGCTANTNVTINQPSQAVVLATTMQPISCFGGSTTANIVASGGQAPYSGTGNYTVNAGEGTVRVAFNTVVNGSFTLLYASVGAITTGTRYALRFSTLGTQTTSRSLRASIRLTNSPWTVLVTRQNGTYNNVRKEHEYIFTAPSNQANVSFLIELDQNAGEVFIDNIAFFEINSSNDLVGNNKYAFGNFEENTLTNRIAVFSSNNNHTASWDSTAKISNVYYYTIRDAANTTAVATVNATQPASSLQVQANAGVISTFGGSTTVTVSATGGVAPYTGTGTFTNVLAGSYSYTVTDANGCSATANVNITQPASLLRTTVVNATIGCFGQSVNVNIPATGGTAPYTGIANATVNAGTGSVRLVFPNINVASNWHTLLYAPVGNISNQKNYVLSFTTFGTSANGSVRAALRQTASPFNLLTDRLTATFGVGRKDHQFVFNAPASWANASFLIEVNQTSDTTYLDNIALFEIDGAGNITGNNLYAAGNFESTANYNTIMSFSSNSNHSMSWDNTSKIGNRYFYPIEDALGNAVNNIVNTVQPATALQINVSWPTILTFGGTTTVTVSANGGTAPYTGTQVIPNVLAGTYTYTITDAAGCTSSRTITVVTGAARTATSNTKPVKSAASNSNLPTTLPSRQALPLAMSIYPNPAKNEAVIQITGGNAEPVSLSVLRADGIIVQHFKGNTNQNYRVGGMLPSGMYIIKLLQGKLLVTQKFIKIK
jgi:hypothetical protein